MSPAILLAVLIYLYAGYAMAELAVPGIGGGSFQKGLTYVIFFVAWILFMPWYPKLMAKRQKGKLL